MSYIKPLANYSEDLKNRMFYDFRDFGTELENFNDQISQTLKIDNYNKEEEFINSEIVFNFYRSNMNAGHFSKGPYMYDYLTFLQSDANEVIKNILSDELISPQEKKYLESLYSYNDDLIKECKSIIGTAYKDFDFDKQKEIKKNIVKIYNNYYEKSENLLNTEKYSFIKAYRGDLSGKDFNEVNFEEAKKYCNELFLKLIKNKSLQEDNSLDRNIEKYTFITSSSSTGHGINDEPVWKVEFNKKTKEVSIRATSFTTFPTANNGFTEQELDSMAKEIVAKFSNSAFRYYKKINYEENSNSEKSIKIRNIKYSYVEEINGIYDGMKKIDICLERQGLISEFQIVYPYNENIIAPIVSKEEILKKIQPGSEITDVLTIRNIEGKTEYEVHLKDNNTIYAAVFDGQKGDLKYYGREIRNYKSQ
ncbi:MAG: hypothetical protein ACI8WT_001467 [Clostridium sp.]|jgi:hypothetical protein